MTHVFVSNTSCQFYRALSFKRLTKLKVKYVRIELAWSWQFSSHFDNIIEVVVLDFCLLILIKKLFFLFKSCVFCKVEFPYGWRFVFGLVLLDVVDVGVFLYF